MNHASFLKDPSTCSKQECQEFERLVRQGFESADERLPGRIRAARWLAFHYEAGGSLAAVAALKAPNEGYRAEVFGKAGATGNPSEYELELGWVFVVPGRRGNRIGGSLCEQLMARVPGSRVFSTTRPNNHAMIRILLALDFVQVGEPYPRRNEELSLFLRP